MSIHFELADKYGVVKKKKLRISQGKIEYFPFNFKALYTFIHWVLVIFKSSLHKNYSYEYPFIDIELLSLKKKFGSDNVNL